MYLVCMLPSILKEIWFYVIFSASLCINIGKAYCIEKYVKTYRSTFQKETNTWSGIYKRCLIFGEVPGVSSMRRNNRDKNEISPYSPLPKSENIRTSWRRTGTFSVCNFLKETCKVICHFYLLLLE
jgi:hypothetical protein